MRILLGSKASLHGRKGTCGFLWKEGRVVKGRGVRRVGMVHALKIFSDKA
jgi:hypothetical protein